MVFEIFCQTWDMTKLRGGEKKPLLMMIIYANDQKNSTKL
jgi:hypothetical protein